MFRPFLTLTLTLTHLLWRSHFPWRFNSSLSALTLTLTHNFPRLRWGYERRSDKVCIHPSQFQLNFRVPLLPCFSTCNFSKGMSQVAECLNWSVYGLLLKIQNIFWCSILRERELWKKEMKSFSKLIFCHYLCLIHNKPRKMENKQRIDFGMLLLVKNDIMSHNFLVSFFSPLYEPEEIK